MIILIRKCPLCNRELSYKSKDAFNRANKENSICKSCSTKKQYQNDPSKNKGPKNGRYGKSIIEISVSKYGEEIGLQKYQEWSQRLGEHGFQNGSLNPSFGKSPPTNSGKSYKGWYKEIFFRSTLELAFILKYEKENGYLPLPADDENYRLFYIDNDGKLRTYVPDFVDLNSKVVFELKCSAFILNELNLIKSRAAKIVYTKIGFQYRVITERDVDNFDCDSFLSKLKTLHESHVIKLTDKSFNKLLKRLKINNGDKMSL